MKRRYVEVNALPRWSAAALTVTATLTVVLAASPGRARGAQQAGAPGRPQAGSAEQAPAGLAVRAKGDARLDDRLLGLADAFEGGGLPAAREYARTHRVPLAPDGSARVLVHANAVSEFRAGEAVAAAVAADEALFAALEPPIRARVEALGGSVGRRMRNLLAAELPIAALRELPGPREIAWVQPAPIPIPMQVRSQGVDVTRAGELQASPVSYLPGSGAVRVGVLDLGFRGYQGLLGTELPPSVTVNSFHPGGIEATGMDVLDAVHGAACAEIVHDMAPDAQLFLANFDDIASHDDAVDWLISQNVDVISYSIGWTNAGPGDGTGPINDAVQRAMNAGIEWVGAAGNEARRHWQGTYTDTNGNAFHEFASGDEANSIFLFAGESLAVWLNWSDPADNWFASTEDYDLFITDAAGNILAASIGAQNGFQWAAEFAAITAPADGTYDIYIGRFSATRNVTLEMFLASPPGMQYLVQSGSLTIPADTPGSIAVGATFHGSDIIEPFSSLGPTTDGRIKPDISAPDGVDTVSYGNLGSPFFGTSAATPHTAGAIALLKSRFGIYGLDDIVQILFGRALDRGLQGKDNVYGEGRLDVKGS